jgi:CheY-like chemotaxis protein
LLVDDDPAFAYATSRRIEEAGHRVITSTNSREAINLLEGDSDIDLLVADIVMPPGHPNGFAIGKAARMRNPDLKVLYMSAYDIQANGLFHGETVLTKPFDLDDLVLEIQTRLDAPREAAR